MNSKRSGYIREIKLKRDRIESNSEFPFTLRFIKNFKSFKLHPNVTFIIGENGTGKSTLLEAIAVAWGFNPEGGTINFNFITHESHSILHKYITIVKNTARPKDGFFLRAESFYNLATNIEQLDQGPGGPPIINSYGGLSLHKQSHGESFFSLFMNRFSSDSLFILDEPEAALSPKRQMALLSKVHQLVERNSQFIISTHSPILMSYPNSIIYSLNKSSISKILYKDTDHYLDTRDFVNNYEKMLKILMMEDV